MLSEGFSRGFICSKMCSGCCPIFSLDYVPSEITMFVNMTEFKQRSIFFNNNNIVVYSDMQKENKGHFCKHVIKETGLCRIHGKQPFSCDFEPLRFKHFKDHASLNLQKFSRGHRFIKIDGSIGALTEVTPKSEISFLDNLKKLRKLDIWAQYFGIKTKIPAIIKYCNNKGYNFESKYF